MSDKASDHDINEHVHTYKHLTTSCKKEYLRSGVIWERRDEFFCAKCLDITVKIRREEHSWKPPWWIEEKDVR